MEKRNGKTSAILLIELFIILLLVSCQVKDQSILPPTTGSSTDEPIIVETKMTATTTSIESSTSFPTLTPTPIQFKQTDYEISQEDLDINIEQMRQGDGLLVTGYTELKNYFGYKSAIHVRWKINSNDTCSSFRFFPYILYKSSAMEPYIIGTGSGCDYMAMGTEITIEDMVTENLPSVSQGTIVLVPGKSIDMVTWLEDGDTPAFYVFAWETENPDIFYLNKTLLIGLKAKSYKFVLNTFNGSINLDKVEIINKDVDSYLWFNALAFNKNYEEIMALYNTDLTLHTDEFTASSSETPSFSAKVYDEQKFVIPLELNFNDTEDGNYFSGVDGTVIIKDGQNKFSQFGTRGMQLRPRINFDTTLHVRWKIGTENTCETFQLYQLDFNDHELKQFYKSKIGGCVSEDLEITFDLADQPINLHLPSESKGGINLENDKWIDAVIWIEKDSSPTLHLFAWETQNPEVYYAEKTMLIGLEEVRNFTFSIETYSGEMEVDFLKMISGDIESYLWFNAPAYQKSNNEVIDVLDADLDAQIVQAEREKDQILASISLQAPEFSKQMESIYTDMLSYEDLPLNYRFHQIEQSVNTSTDYMQFTKTYLQGPTSSGGGLWLTNTVIIRDEPFKSEEEFISSLNFDSRKDQLRSYYPEVGDFSISFFHISFERYAFSKGNITVDFYCNSLFTGTHPYCNPETLAGLAQIIYDRLPDQLEKPGQIALSIPTDSTSDYFNQLEVGGGNQSMLIWNASTWLPSMNIALYNRELKQFVYYSQGVDVADFRIGNGEMSIKPEQTGGKMGLLPGDYILYVIVNREKAGEIRFTLQE